MVCLGVLLGVVVSSFFLSLSRFLYIFGPLVLGLESWVLSLGSLVLNLESWVLSLVVLSCLLGSGLGLGR